MCCVLITKDDFILHKGSFVCLSLGCLPAGETRSSKPRGYHEVGSNLDDALRVEEFLASSQIHTELGMYRGSENRVTIGYQPSPGPHLQIRGTWPGHQVKLF